MTLSLPSHLQSVRPSEVGADVDWQCPFECGQCYKRSSGRSIRRHVTACFRCHHASAAALSDSELSTLIGAQQDSGKLNTGLRRWRMRQPRRMAAQLSDNDRWDCIWQCGKSYRSTSSRSIQRHANQCSRRADGQKGDVDVKRFSKARIQSTNGAAVSQATSDGRTKSESGNEGSHHSMLAKAIPYWPCDSIAPIDGIMQLEAVHEMKQRTGLAQMAAEERECYQDIVSSSMWRPPSSFSQPPAALTGSAAALDLNMSYIASELQQPSPLPVSLLTASPPLQSPPPLPHPHSVHSPFPPSSLDAQQPPLSFHPSHYPLTSTSVNDELMHNQLRSLFTNLYAHHSSYPPLL